MLKDLVLSGDTKKIYDFLAIALEGVEQPVSPDYRDMADLANETDSFGNYLVDREFKQEIWNGEEGLLFIAPENNVDMVDEFLSYEELEALYAGEPIFPAVH